MGIYQINGIQQIGVGTEDFSRTRDLKDMNCCLLPAWP